MAKLEDVLQNFENRIARLERQLGQQSQQNQLPPASTSLKEPVRTDAVSTTTSSSLLAYIGIAFVILAGVFFIKITIDSGWLTPVRQVLLASATGIVFLLLPQFAQKAEKEYGGMLAGAGVTILHIAWLGAYFYHHIASATTALICASLVGLLFIVANFDKGNRIYVLIALAGTYLSAPLIGYSTGDFSILSVFLVIWNLSFASAAFIGKRRDVLYIASYYAVFTVLLLSGKAQVQEQYTELLILQLIQFVIFSTVMTGYSMYHKITMTTEESVANFPLLVLFYFSTEHLIAKLQPDFAPWFGLITAAVIFAIYFILKNNLKETFKSGPSLTAFIALAFVHSFYFQLLDEGSKPAASLVVGIAILLAWKKFAVARQELKWPLLILGSTVAYGALLTLISSRKIDHVFFYNWAFGMLALVAAIGFSNGAQNNKSSVTSLLLGFAHVEVMLGLYRFSKQVTWSGALFVTLSWGLYALVVLALAHKRRDKILGNSALTILLAVSLKAFLYDVLKTSNLVRVLCLLAEGLLLYWCGWIFKKMQSWGK